MLNSTFPRALLPMTSVYKSLRKFVPAACVLAVLFPLVGGKLGPGLFVLPLLFSIQIDDERRHRVARLDLRRPLSGRHQPDDLREPRRCSS